MKIYILQSNITGEFEVESIHSLLCLARSAAMTMARELTDSSKLTWSGAIDCKKHVFRAYIRHDNKIITFKTIPWDISNIVNVNYLTSILERMNGGSTDGMSILQWRKWGQS